MKAEGEAAIAPIGHHLMLFLHNSTLCLSFMLVPHARTRVITRHLRAIDAFARSPNNRLLLHPSACPPAEPSESRCGDAHLWHRPRAPAQARKSDIQLHEQRAGETKKTSSRPTITCQPNPENAKFPTRPAISQPFMGDVAMATRVVGPARKAIAPNMALRRAAALAIRRSDRACGACRLVSPSPACCGSFCGAKGGLGEGPLC